MKNIFAVLFFLCISFKSIIFSQVIYNNSFGSSAAEAGFTSILSNSGFFYTIGWTENTSNGNSDVLLIKTDKSGMKLWEKTFGLSDKESGISLIELSNGNLLIGGSGRSIGIGLSDCLLISVDESGNELWTRSYGTTQEDYLRKVIELPNHDLLICGYTEAGNGGKDLLAIKISEAGNVLWANALGGINDEEGWTVDVDDAGNSYFGGWTKSTTNGNSDFYLVKLSAAGNIDFEKKFGGNNVDSGLSLILNDEKIYFAGSTLSYGNGKSDIILYILDLNGDIISFDTYGSPQDDYCRSISLTESGFCLAGYTTGYNSVGNDIIIVLTDGSGNFTQHYVINEAKDQDAWGAVYTEDNTVLITGRGVNPNRSDYDIKLISYRIGTSSSNEIYSSLLIYPNPATNYINIPKELDFSGTEIYNEAGTCVYKKPTYSTEPIDISNLPGGLYILKIVGLEKTEIVKFKKI